MALACEHCSCRTGEDGAADVVERAVLGTRVVLCGECFWFTEAEALAALDDERAFHA